MTNAFTKMNRFIWQKNAAFLGNSRIRLISSAVPEIKEKNKSILQIKKRPVRKKKTIKDEEETAKVPGVSFYFSDINFWRN